MRYLPLTADDRRDMLNAIGAQSIDDLFEDVPATARDAPDLKSFPRHLGEIEVERRLSAMAGKNVSAGDAPFFVGGGAYRHHIPASVDHIIQRSEFLTSYTPYQPEISQGTLQYLFEFQTQICMLTGMEIANASMYDGSTACAEAVLMANRVTKRSKVVLSGGLHPQYADIIETNARFTGDQIVRKAPAPEGQENLIDLIDDETSCVVVQTPSFFGNLHDVSELADAAHANGALLIVALTEVASLGALKPPGDMGTDIVVAEGQSIGNPLNFGGPYVGLFATRKKYLRQMPGRLCGETVDADGRRGYVLTLSTREQHIRREKATSNICTNSGLCSLAFTIHLSLLGEGGLTQLASLNHQAAVRLAEMLEEVGGIELVTPSFFNEFTIRLPKPAEPIVDTLAERGILAGIPASRLYPDDPTIQDLLILAVTELNTPAELSELRDALSEVI